MSTDFKRINRTAVSALGITSLLVTSLLITSPAPAQAEDAVAPATKAEAIAAADGSISSLNQQASSLQAQISETDARIAQLEAENAALKVEQERDEAMVSQTIRDSYIAGNPSEVEVIASNESFSGVVGQQTYRGQVSDKVQAAVEKAEESRQKIEENIDTQKGQRDGLVAMKGQLDQKIATVQAQEAAKQQLEQMQEEQYAQAVAADKAQKAEALASAAAPASSKPSAQPAAGPVSGISGGNNPYPFGQCTWYVYSATGRGQNGNAGTWRPSSSTPAPGKIMIWAPGEQGAGGAGHVGVVASVSGNNVVIRHMNWGGGFGQVTTGTFRSTGKFY